MTRRLQYLEVFTGGHSRAQSIHNHSLKEEEEEEEEESEKVKKDVTNHIVGALINKETVPESIVTGEAGIPPRLQGSAVSLRQAAVSRHSHLHGTSSGG